MRWYVAAVLFIGVASAWPWDMQQGAKSSKVSREDLLDRQVKLLNLLERIHEPSFHEDVSSVSQSYNPADHPDSFRDNGHAAKEMVEEFKDGKLRERGAYFSLFDSDQRHQAIEFFEALFYAKDFDTFYKTAAWGRERLNEGIFAYGLMTAALNRDDLRGVRFPAPYEINPHFFVPTEVIHEAYRAQMKQMPKTIASTFTGTKKNLEQRVAYFGEDVGLEAHHYHWHMDWPFWWKETYGQKDRKGELFFYMHHQLTARFDAERLSNDLPRVEALGWNEELTEGFAPHASYYHEGEFPIRPDHMKFHDLPEVSLHDMDRYTDRVLEAIDKLEAEANDGHKVSLNSTAGIDVLAAIIEASEDSPNMMLYGSIHNFCHMLLARIMDPDHKYGEPPGVMEHFETSTRDPTFFRLHKFIDVMFKRYKNNMGPYSKNDLELPGVEIKGIKVTTTGQNPNTLLTYFKDFEFDLNNALEHVSGKEDVDIKASVKRLNHEPFQYNIEVKSNANHLVTVRTFLAPKYEQYGGEISVDEKRWNMIELDKFVAKLAAGSNTIVRSSKDSSVTIPDFEGFKTLKQKALDAINGDQGFQIDENARHCGMPDGLLIPKGCSEGTDFELWVTLTDYEADKVHDVPHDFDYGGSMSYCGYQNEKYPDNKAMGFPWDRPIENMEDFLTPNTQHVDIKIVHKEHH